MVTEIRNIGLVEPSDILFEGLSNILLSGNYKIKLFRITDLDDYRKSHMNVDFDVMVIDTMLIQNRIKQFRTFKGDNPGTRWIGLVHSLVNNEIISEFDSVIRVDDKAEDIFGKVVNQSVELKPKTLSMQNSLSSREIDVLKLLSGGLSNKEIAEKLKLSIHTVISHRKNITQKTGIKSQPGLTIYAISNNIISLG